MYSGKSLDDLIEAGWHVIDTEFDAGAFYYWKKKALDFLTDFVGPDHESTRSFKNCIEQTKGFDPLDHRSILTAASKDTCAIEEEGERLFLASSECPTAIHFRANETVSLVEASFKPALTCRHARVRKNPL